MADTRRPRLRLHTFGGLRLLDGETPVGGAGQQPRRLALLAMLAAHPTTGVTRAKLLGQLWPETPEDRGRQALSQALYALRRDAGGQSLVRGAAELLELDPSVISSDIGEFLQAEASADHARMASLYVGPFLDGIFLDDALGFERWADDVRARLASRAASAFEHLATTADGAGDHAAAVHWWRRLTDVDAFGTQAALGLMSALHRHGQRGVALEHAERYGARVREDLDREPSPAVVDAAERLRRLSAPAAHTSEPSPPATMGESTLAARYVLGREIGRGGMAAVFLARDVRHERDVAIKMLHPELAEALGRERLSREILVTAALRHPNILPLFDSGEWGGTLFYVMPFVDGETLRAMLARAGTLPVDVAVRLCGEVADALAHAHARGIIHRDIKPENILISDSHAIVADFGIARLVSDASQPMLTQAGFAVGTPAYMSPEQFTDGRDADGRSDVFSLACVMYEMLAGRPPWIATSAHMLLTKRLVEVPPLVNTFRPETPAAIAHLLARALHPDPEQRTITSAEFAAQLAPGAAPSPLRDTALLPQPRGGLIGRDRELATAGALLTRPEIRLLTVTGAGGAGKTHFALRVAGDAGATFTDGVRFIDLSSVHDADGVLTHIAATLGAREGEGRSALDALVHLIGERQVLLLLDNFEQVVAGAVALTPLLTRCQHLTLLVTSRIRLRLRGEHEFHLAPLAVPDLASTDAEAYRASPAVDLFLRVARDAQQDFHADDVTLRAIAEICTRLDGLPLAIELAASRCRVLSPRAIIARMDRRFDLLVGGARDLPTRQQTLRGAIAWGYDLLAPADQLALRGLAAFAGGAAFTDAVAVLSTTEDALLDAVQTLVDSCLVRRVEMPDGDTRFTMLESIREFCADAAVSAGDADEIRDRHFRVFADLAGSLPAALEGAHSVSALARFDQERDNFNAALDHADRRTDGAGFGRLVLSLWRAWLVRGAWGEARRRIARGIQMPAVHGTALHAELLGADSTLAQNQGDYQIAYQSAEHALSLWRALGERGGEARTLGVMGWLAWRLCAFTDARRLSAECLALHREQGNPRGVALALSNLGSVALFEGHLETSREALTESLGLRHALGDTRNVAFTLTVLGWTTLRSGDHDRAMTFLREACEHFETLGERQLLAFNGSIRALAAGERGDLEIAEQLVTESITVFRDIGDRWGLSLALRINAEVAMQKQHFEDAARAVDEARAIASATGDRYGVLQADACRVRLQQHAPGMAHSELTGLVDRVAADALALGVPNPLTSGAAPPSPPSHP